MMDDINACGEEDIKGKVNNSQVRYATAKKNKMLNSHHHRRTPNNHLSRMDSLEDIEAEDMAQSYT